MRFKSLIAATLLGVATVVALPVGTPVAAAEPTCNSTSNRAFGTAKVTLPSYGSDLDCILGPGNQGPAVRYLQYSLIFCNNADTGGLDGVYGTKTRNAIAWIQAANGLTADGVYGPKTRKVLLWLYSDGKCRGWIAD